MRPSDLADGGLPLAIGLAPQPDGSYALAVRYRLGLPSVRSIARKVVAEVGLDADVRRTGRIRTLTLDDDRRGSVRARPVITARSLGETGRVRPLRPGISIAHVDVTAGTLGAFVRKDGVVHALSNYHVLSGSPQGRVGDAHPAAGSGRRRAGAAGPRRHAGRPRGPGAGRATPRSTAPSRCWTTRTWTPTYPVGRITHDRRRARR